MIWIPSLVAQRVKHLPTMRETWLQSLGREDLLEKGMATHSRILPPPDFPGGSDGKASAHNAGDPASIPGSGRSPGEGNGNTLVFLPGKSHG